MTRDTVRTVSEDIRRMLGYSIHPPFIGRVDGMHPNGSSGGDPRLERRFEERQHPTISVPVAASSRPKPMMRCSG